MSWPRHCTIEELLDPTPGDDAKAHLDACPSCRIDARLLREALTVELDAVPGLESARRSMDSLRQTLSSSLALSGTFESEDSSCRTEFDVEPQSQEPLATPLAPGVLVDNYRILRRLGGGGMGEVFLARDTGLGRKVALKVLRSRDLGSTRSIERFLFEARTTARFNHPHIVTIHAVGEYGGNPYVALEYLEGKTLRQRMAEERLGLRDTLRIGLAIAEALAEAHRYRVLHRDLKPENVMIGRDGIVRVLDFGLAKQVSAEAVAVANPATVSINLAASPDQADVFESRVGSVRGTPPYMAPEQWLGEDITGATDVWALGMVIRELLAGEHPLAGMNVISMCVQITQQPIPPLDEGDLPPQLVFTIARCLDMDPRRRPGISELAETLAQFAAVARPGRSDEEPPFRGLLPCAERDAERFFGRSSEVAAFLERLREEPALAVVGASGSGKSSFVQAGIIPKLREQGRWIVLQLRPGRDPMRSLAESLLVGDHHGDSVRASQSGSTSVPGLTTAGAAGSTAPTAREIGTFRDELARELEEAPSRLALRLVQVAELGRTSLDTHPGDLEGARPAQVLLFVDQLEELYTLVTDSVQRRAFMEAICLAADDPYGPVRMVMTLRDDFLARLAEGPAARAALERVTVLRTPGSTALREIITRPVELAGYTYDDPALVDEMVAAVRDETAALPLLQVVGKHLWLNRDTKGRLLLRSEYEAMGGVAGALAHHADGVLAGLHGEQLLVARDLLLRLVGTDGTRQVVTRKDLLAGLPAHGAGVLVKLVTGRLILVRQTRSLPDTTRDADDATSGVAEPQMDDNANLELVHESLIGTWNRLRRWIEENHEDRVFLAEVQQAASLWERRGRRSEEVWTGDALSDARRRVGRVATLPDAVRAFLAASTQRDEARVRRRRTLLVAGFAALAALSSVLGWMNHRTAQQRDLAQEGRAVALMEGARTATLRGDLLEARSKLRGALEARDSSTARALWWDLGRRPLVWHKELEASPYDLSFSPDGSSIAVCRADGAVQLFDTATGRPTTLRDVDDQHLTVEYSPDGRILASGTYAGTLVMWDLDGEAVRTAETGMGELNDIRFSADGSVVGVVGWSEVARLFDTSTLQPLQDLVGHDGKLHSLDIAPRGGRIATAGSDSTVRLWDMATGEQQRILSGHDDRVQSVRFSPDGRSLASAGRDRSVKLWDVETGQEVLALEGHSDTVYHVAFSPDGSVLASAGKDLSIRIWDLKTGQLIRTLDGHEGWVRRISFSPDGLRLASLSHRDETIRLWDFAREAVETTAKGHVSSAVGVTFLPDGRRLASSSYDGTVRLWDVASGEQIKALAGPADGLARVRIDPAGNVVAAAGLDGSVYLWDPETGETLDVLSGHEEVAYDVRFSADGRALAASGWSGDVLLWKMPGAERGPSFTTGGPAVWGIDLSPDGQFLAGAAIDGNVYLWRADTGELVRSIDMSPWPVHVEFSADSRQLACGGEHDLLAVVELEGWVRKELRDAGRLQHINWSVTHHPDAERIGVASGDGTAAIVPLDGSAPTVLRGHRGEVIDLAFSPQGDLAATAGDEGTIRLWHTDTGQPAWWTLLMMGPPVEILTHRGWFRSAESGVEPPVSAWRSAVTQDARLAAADGGLVCLQKYDDQVQLWDTDDDQLLSEQRLPAADQIVAHPAGCALLGEAGGVRFIDRDGRPTTSLTGAVALARDPDGALVISDKRVALHGPTGHTRVQWDVGAGLTSAVRHGDALIQGYRDGEIIAHPRDSHSGDPRVVLEDAPSSPVVSLLPGPMDTLIAGFANGVLGFWSLQDGANLHRTKLHGAVTHLIVEGPTLQAATELGDLETVDLSTFERPYCDVVTDVWSAVPVIWSDTGPVVQAPSPDHPCAR